METFSYLSTYTVISVRPGHHAHPHSQLGAVDPRQPTYLRPSRDRERQKTCDTPHRQSPFNGGLRPLVVGEGIAAGP